MINNIKRLERIKPCNKVSQSVAIAATIWLEEIVNELLPHLDLDNPTLVTEAIAKELNDRMNAEVTIEMRICLCKECSNFS